ncbi:unnamed protein product [Toxocara canis]|uniref:Transposase n=1 Tax=Toxocara canis TaxID=6265 RepID=A0A183UPG2_TOXCA|nr:unnamed protein product [Toxocara canis]
MITQGLPQQKRINLHIRRVGYLEQKAIFLVPFVPIHPSSCRLSRLDASPALTSLKRSCEFKGRYFTEKPPGTRVDGWRIFKLWATILYNWSA